MTDKVKTLSTVSLVLSIAVISFCFYNFNGALSEPLRGVNQVSFYGVLGGPVAVALVALVLGLMAWMSAKIIVVMTSEEPEKVQA